MNQVLRGVAVLGARSCAGLLLGSCLASCRTRPPVVPVSRIEMDWPETPHWENISRRLYVETGPQDPLPFNLDARDLDVKCYTGPSQGFPHKDALLTSVYYLRASNRFYVRCGCREGHYDGFCGPFGGDPRIWLRPK